MMDAAGLLLFALLRLATDSSVSLSDLRQLPPRELAGPSRKLAAQARDLARMRESIEPHRAGWWYDTQCEASAAFDAWDLLLEAHDSEAHLERRLGCLERLRTSIGWQRYYAGRMPSPVPLWRFPRCD